MKKKHPVSFGCIKKLLRKYHKYSPSLDDDIIAYIPYAQGMGLDCYEAYKGLYNELKLSRKKEVKFDEIDYFSKSKIATNVPIFEKMDVNFIKDTMPAQWYVNRVRYSKGTYAVLYAAKYADYYDLELTRLPKIPSSSVRNIKKTKDTWFESVKEVYPKYAEIYPNREPIQIVQLQEVSQLRSVGNRKR